MKPTISIIAAISKNRVIGNENKLLWHIPGELPRFKKLTLGHPIIMGRKTHESIGRILPGRTNIIVTRDPIYKVDGALIAHSLEDAIEQAKQTEQQEIFIIGGGQIYTQALPFTTKLYLTVIDKEFLGDAHFPDYSAFKTILSSETQTSPEFSYTFLELTR